MGKVLSDYKARSPMELVDAETGKMRCRVCGFQRVASKRERAYNFGPWTCQAHRCKGA